MVKQEKCFKKISSPRSIMYLIFITWYNRPMWYLQDTISFFSFKSEENLSLFFERYFKKNNSKNNDKKISPYQKEWKDQDWVQLV